MMVIRTPRVAWPGNPLSNLVHSTGANTLRPEDDRRAPTWCRCDRVGDSQRVLDQVMAMITSSDGRVEAARSGAGVRCLPWLPALIILASLAALLTAPLPTGAAKSVTWSGIGSTWWSRCRRTARCTSPSATASASRVGRSRRAIANSPDAYRAHRRNPRAGSRGNSLLPYRTVSPGSFSRANPNTYSVQRIGTNFRIQRLPANDLAGTDLPDRLQRPRGAAGLDSAPVPYQQISWSGVAPS